MPTWGPYFEAFMDAERLLAAVESNGALRPDLEEHRASLGQALARFKALGAEGSDGGRAAGHPRAREDAGPTARPMV